MNDGLSSVSPRKNWMEAALYSIRRCLGVDPSGHVDPEIVFIADHWPALLSKMRLFEDFSG
jgi:hypothetical protein